MFWRPRRITDRRVAPSHRRVNGRGRWYNAGGGYPPDGHFAQLRGHRA